MSDELPAGYVDPLDPAQVAPVLRSAHRQLGLTGLLELLARVPGMTVEPERPGGALRRPLAASVTGGQDVVRLTTPATREHVVGGIVLSRTDVPPAQLPALLALACRDAVLAEGEVMEASIALTSARDAMDNM
ncbi:MAG: hypothetical protein ACR2KG_10580 [Nocardioidaceae bacterium]